MPSVSVKDAAIAAAVLAGTLVLLAGDGLGPPGAGARELDGLGVLLAVVTALPLALGRGHPLVVLGVVSAAAAALLALSYPLDVPFGAPVAAFRVAVTHAGDPRLRRRLAGMASIAAVVPVLAVALALRGSDVSRLLVPELLAWAGVFVGVWVAGDRAQLRAARFADLQSRAARLERDAARERELAIAGERTRIARELHDSAGHAITVVLVQAGAARLLLDKDPGRSREALETIEHVARQTVTEIDRLVHALREDDATPDPDALEALIDAHRDAGLAVAAEVDGDRHRAPRSAAWAAYRIVQESLTNAARHGRGAAQVSVRFGELGVEIDVRNPLGNSPPDRPGGHGIPGMRERAALLGGTLDAAADGEVFRLHGRLPYREAPA